MATQTITQANSITKEQDLGFEAIDLRDAVQEYRRLSMDIRSMWSDFEKVIKEKGHEKDLGACCEDIDGFMKLLAKLDNNTAYTAYLERKKH